MVILSKTQAAYNHHRNQSDTRTVSRTINKKSTPEGCLFLLICIVGEKRTFERLRQQSESAEQRWRRKNMRRSRRVVRRFYRRRTFVFSGTNARKALEKVPFAFVGLNHKKSDCIVPRNTIF